MKIKEFLNKDLTTKNERKAVLVARLGEINKRTAELGVINERSCDEKELKATAEELDKLKAELAEKQAELAGLEAEIKELEQMIADADKPADDNQEQPQRKQFLNFESRGGKNMNMTEERQKQIDEFVKTRTLKSNVDIMKRALLVSSGTIATPTGVDDEIRDTFNHVPSIVDLVDILDCEGMGSYKIPYEVSISEAAETTEGQAYNSSDPVYAYITLSPTTYTVLSQISKQVLKQTPVKYVPKVEDSAYKALREKAAKVITDAIVASTLNTVVNAKLDANSKGVIDENTLRNIALNYGTDETVPGEAVLMLTKQDLVAFGDVRSDTTLQAVYEITPDPSNPNTGIIKDGGLAVKYILNPNLTAISGTAQPASSASSIVGMLYGQPRCCALALFSGYEVKLSEDYAFNTGMLTIRGDVELDADVVKKNGFVAFTLAKATA